MKRILSMLSVSLLSATSTSSIITWNNNSKKQFYTLGKSHHKVNKKEKKITPAKKKTKINKELNFAIKEQNQTIHIDSNKISDSNPDYGNLTNSFILNAIKKSLATYDYKNYKTELQNYWHNSSNLKKLTLSNNESSEEKIQLLKNKNHKFSLKIYDDSNHTFNKITINIMLNSSWINKIPIHNNNKISLAFNNHYLPSSSSLIDQKGWLNINDQNNFNNTLYAYIPNSNINDAIKEIKVSDSAFLDPAYGFKKNSINWIKNGNSYTNTPFITQNTTIGSWSTITPTRKKAILASQNFSNIDKNGEIYKDIQKYGFINFMNQNKFSKKTEGLKYSWWNIKNWQSHLTLQSSKDNYLTWANPLQLKGLNVSLSNVLSNSINISNTTIKNLYKIEINLKENYWVPGLNASHTFSVPHWGLALKIGDNYISPQLATNLRSTCNYSQLDNYLNKNYQDFNQLKKEYNKVNSQLN